MKTRLYLSAVFAIGLAPTTAFADDGGSKAAGVSAIWILANFCYAGMRAQSNPGTGWRIVSFLFGFPGTLLSMFVVDEGGERVYGVDLPRSARTRSIDGTPGGQ